MIKDFHICRRCGYIYPVQVDEEIPRVCGDCGACSWIITKRQLADTVSLLHLNSEALRLRAGRYILTRTIRRRARFR